MGALELEEKEHYVDFCEYMLLIVSNVLGKKEQAFFLDTPISQFGLDSIGVTKIMSIVNKVFKLKISPVSLYGHKTIQEAASHLYYSFKDKINFSEITAQFVQLLCDDILPTKNSNLNKLETSIQENIDNSASLITSTLETVQKKSGIITYTILDSDKNQVGEICFSDQGDEYFFDKADYSVYEKTSSKIVNTKQHEAIAVVGMAGIFPQSDSCEEFWQNLEAGKDLISEIPENRWDWKKIYGEPDNESQVTDIKWGGFLNDIEAFDASFFNISSKEAQLMDPMQRKLIQVVWQAVEDAGYRMSDLAGKKVGVFVGIGTFDYLQLVLENNKFTHAYAATGIVHCMASNRISYLFDFKGASESVDTACSSSLVALHRAVGLIRNNECEMAIVCGANVLLSSSVYVALSNAGMLSKSGKCRTFDDAADGYVRGEGVAAIVLRKLSEAKHGHDHIYGLIKGAAVNHGGHTSSLTAPNPFSQAEVIQASLKDAKIDADTISYVETHGTATALGDPIEISGLATAFAAASSGDSNAQYCALGSVKTNIGHLEAAAGIASVIKILLSMHHKKIPAHLHLKALNKNISLEETPFYLNDNTTEWKALKDKAGKKIPRRAGVSSFGFGGVNSHVTLEEYQEDHVKNDAEVVKKVFLFSAKTETALNNYVSTYCRFIKENADIIDLNNMAYTLQVGRESFNYRLAVIAINVNELLEKLEYFFKNKFNFSSEKIDTIFYSKIENKFSSAISQSNNEDLEALTQRWILGENINWQQFYAGQSVSRMSLPTYPFEKTYHWITNENKKKNEPALVKDAYDVNWYAEELSGEHEEENVEYIVFCDRQGISESLNISLLSKNVKAHKIYYDGDIDNIDNVYTVDSKKLESYIDAFTKISSRSRNKTFYVLNLWPLDFGQSSEQSLEELNSDYQFLCQAALYQVQALNFMKQEFKSHLWIVCSNVQALQNNKINLSSAPLWGMAKTLVLEQPSLFRSIIDINLNEEIDVENLLREISSFSKESEVVYRQGIRYVPRMEPCEVKKNSGHHLKSNGAYLITGGLGVLGLLVAEWLSSLKVRKIYLLSRRSLENSKDSSAVKEAIHRMQLNGTEVEILQGDVTNFKQMQSITRNHLDNNELKGVFHLAGLYQENLLEDMKFEDFKSVVSAKVEGTWILHKLFKDHHLDCFVMFSSGASVWGAATGGHYSAGNYFLDAYADYCHANNFPALSISWGGLWRSSGIIPKNKEEYFKSIGVKETSSEEGMQQLASIIDADCHKKIIAPIEWPLFLEVMNANREKSLFNKINIKPAYVDNANVENNFFKEIINLSSRNDKYSFILSEIKNLIKSILSIENEVKIEEDTGFFNLGLDSLASIDFKNKINKTMGVKISTTTLFDCNTLKLLCNFLLINFFEESGDKDEMSELNEFDKNELLRLLELELNNGDRREL